MRESYWIKPDGDIIHALEGHQSYIKEHWQEHDLPSDISMIDLIINGWVRVSGENVMLRQVDNPEVLTNLQQLLIALGYDQYIFWINSRPHNVALETIQSTSITDIYRDILAGKFEMPTLRPRTADAYDQGIFETQPSWGESESAGSTGMKDRGTEFMPQDKTKEVWWNRDLLDYQKKNFPGKKDTIPPEDDNGYPTQASDIVDRMKKKAEYSETCECGGPSYKVYYEPTGELVLRCEDCGQEFESDEAQWRDTEPDIEIVRRHNSSDNEIPENKKNHALSQLMQGMGINFGFARQFLNEYNLHTITNNDAVKILNSVIGIMDEREKEMKDLEDEWSRESSQQSKWYRFGNNTVRAFGGINWGGILTKAQDWSDGNGNVPKTFNRRPARIELDENYIAHFYYVSTEIVTADMKNKKVLMTTEGDWHTPTTRNNMSNILWSLHSLGYPMIRPVRGEYDSTETDEQREEEEARLNEQDRQRRNKRSREKRQEIRDTKKLRDEFPKEFEELNSGDYGYHSRLTREDIEKHIANKESERIVQEKYPKEYEVLKKHNRYYVTLEDVEEYINKLKEKQELIEKYPREFKELTDEGNADINVEDLEERRKVIEMKDLEDEWSREGGMSHILRTAWDNPDPSAEDAQTSPMEESNSNRMIDPDGTLYRKQKGRGAPMGDPSEDGELKCNLPANLTIETRTASDIVEEFLISKEKELATEPQIRQELYDKGITEQEINETYRDRSKNLYKVTK